MNCDNDTTFKTHTIKPRTCIFSAFFSFFSVFSVAIDNLLAN